MSKREGILFEDGYEKTKGKQYTTAPTIRQMQCQIKTDAPPPPSDLGPALVPSMREIEAIEPNGLRIVSTFSGWVAVK